MTNQTNSADSVDLELAKEELRRDISLMEDLESLRTDERFQRVFIEDFCDRVVKAETAQLISQNEYVREAALEKIKAAKYLEAYMSYVVDCGNAAKTDLLEGGL